MAGTEVGSLYYDLSIDDKKLKSGLDSADKSVKSLGGTLNKFGDTVQAGFREVGKVLAVAGVGLTAFAKNATDFTKDFVKNSKALGTQIGVSTTEASRLVAAFGRMGIEADSASQMFGIFSKNISASTAGIKDSQLAMTKLQTDIAQTKNEIRLTTAEIAKHGDKTGELTLKIKSLQVQLQQQQSDLSKNTDAFQKLGVSTTDATGKQKDFNTILFEVADKFKAMPNGVEKTTLSLELFGRSGKDMIKVLNLGSDGIRDLEAKADKLGLTLNEKTIGAVAQLVKSQKDLKDQTDALKIAVGTATAPVLAKFNEKIVELTQNLLNSGEPMKSITTNVLAFGGPIATAGAALAGFLGNISNISGKVGLLALKLGAVGIVIAIVAGVLYELQQHFHIFDGLIDKVKDGLADLKDKFGSFKDTAETLKKPIQDIKEKLEGLQPIVIVLSQFWEQTLKPALEAVGSALKEKLIPAFEQILDAVKRLWDALNPGLMTALKIIGAILGVELLVFVWLAISVWNILIQVFSFVISVISNVIKWIANLAQWFGDLVGIVINVVRDVAGWFGKLPGYVGNAIGGVIDFFRKLPGRIVEAAGNLASTLANAGKDLIQGLINGIRNKFNDVKNTLSELTKKLTSWKGPENVDKKLLFGSAQLIMGGFVAGLESQYGAVKNSLLGLTSDIGGSILAPNINVGANGAAAGGGGNTTHNYGGTTVNIGTVEDRQDADYILRTVDQNQNRIALGVTPL